MSLLQISDPSRSPGDLRRLAAGAAMRPMARGGVGRPAGTTWHAGQCARSLRTSRRLRILTRHSPYSQSSGRASGSERSSRGTALSGSRSLPGRTDRARVSRRKDGLAGGNGGLTIGAASPPLAPIRCGSRSTADVASGAGGAAAADGASGSVSKIRTEPGSSGSSGRPGGPDAGADRDPAPAAGGGANVNPAVPAGLGRHTSPQLLTTAS